MDFSNHPLVKAAQDTNIPSQTWRSKCIFQKGVLRLLINVGSEQRRLTVCPPVTEFDEHWALHQVGEPWHKCVPVVIFVCRIFISSVMSTTRSAEPGRILHSRLPWRRSSARVVPRWMATSCKVGSVPQTQRPGRSQWRT